ncbi:MAG: hypothetical protein QOF58_8754, partial [Pseudonocardiales bacterium]|nr:hypothetical protein [Pseudonocardiales bacterium]
MTAYGFRRAGKAASLLVAVVLPAALVTPAASAANTLS